MTSTISIRMDQSLKADAEAFFDEIGLNMTTAITCFFKKCLAVGEIPFTLGTGKKDMHAKLLAIKREADAVANDSGAPSCSDLSKLDEFLLS